MDIEPERVRNWKPALGSSTLSHSRVETNWEKMRDFDPGSSVLILLSSAMSFLSLLSKQNLPPWAANLLARSCDDVL